MFGEDVSVEDINRKIQIYDDLFSKLRLLIINEETKRGFFLKISSNFLNYSKMIKI
jgi:hypothetical protein